MGEWILRLTTGVLFGVVGVGARRIRARRWPDAPRWVDVSEAAEDGVLPAGADPVAWQAALERRRAEIRQETSIGVVALVIAAFAMLALVSTVNGSPAVFVLPAVLALWIGWLIATRKRRLARVDSLLVRLQQAAAQPGRWDPPAMEQPQ